MCSKLFAWNSVRVSYVTYIVEATGFLEKLVNIVGDWGKMMCWPS